MIDSIVNRDVVSAEKLVSEINNYAQVDNTKDTN